MKKRILSILISAALLFSHNMSLVNAAAEKFNGYDAVDGIIMDEEAQEKVKKSDEKLDSQQLQDENLNQTNESEDLLLEEELSLLEEEENYSDKFIVKYRNAGKKKAAKLEKASRKALKKAKSLKSEKEA